MLNHCILGLVAIYVQVKILLRYFLMNNVRQAALYIWRIVTRMQPGAV